jgi:hypothetical protein
MQPITQSIPQQNIEENINKSTLDAEAIAEESVWDVWPYSWFINGYNFLARSFHSFHQKLFTWKLMRHNRRMQAAFRARYWHIAQQRCWHSEGDDEFGMRLV